MTLLLKGTHRWYYFKIETTVLAQIVTVSAYKIIWETQKLHLWRSATYRLTHGHERGQDRLTQKVKKLFSWFISDLFSRNFFRTRRQQIDASWHTPFCVKNKTDFEQELNCWKASVKKFMYSYTRPICWGGSNSKAYPRT